MSAVNMHPIAVTGGKTYRIAVDAPPRGEIKKALVMQTSGTLEGFGYSFYDSAVGCPPGIDNDAATDAIKEARSQITAIRTVPSGKDRYLLTDGTDGGFSSAGYYANADGGSSNAGRKLYLKLKVLGSGAKEFGVFLGIDPAKGG